MTTFNADLIESNLLGSFRMTGTRDLERHQRELCEIFGIHDGCRHDDEGCNDAD